MHIKQCKVIIHETIFIHFTQILGSKRSGPKTLFVYMPGLLNKYIIMLNSVLNYNTQ